MVGMVADSLHGGKQAGLTRVLGGLKVTGIFRELLSKD
jgi:hypothetical protein